MTASRDIGDINTDPGGRSGADWTSDARDSLAALWALNGGMLLSVAGTNVLTARLAVAEGFTAYSDGLRCGFVASASNTGPATINIGGVGAMSIRSPDGDALDPASIVAGRFTDIVFVAKEDHFRLVTSGGTVNVSVEGGILVQRSNPSRLSAQAGPATAVTVVASLSFQCLYSTSRVILEGVVGRVTAAGGISAEGTVIALYVDGVAVQSFTDACVGGNQVNTPFYFPYVPGETGAHTYEVRVSSTLAATYGKGVNVIWASEIALNG